MGNNRTKISSRSCYKKSNSTFTLIPTKFLTFVRVKEEFKQILQKSKAQSVENASFLKKMRKVPEARSR